MKPLILAFAVLTGAALLASAQSQTSQNPLPPPEALKACFGKRSGEACSFQARNSEKVEGICFSPDPAKRMGCRPKPESSAKQ